MRAVLKLELFGDNLRREFARAEKRMRETIGDGVANAFFGQERPPRPWVAKITGFHDRYEFAREFQRGTRDYSRANSKGSRGIYRYYWLKPGIYEVNMQTSWKRWRCFFLQVDKYGEKEEISKDEVIQCLTTNDT